MKKNRSIYVLLSQTHTMTAAIIRVFGQVKYNHCAIALDKELNELYSFARPQQHLLFMGKMVKETRNRYTLNESVSVPVSLIEIPVTEKQYSLVKEQIEEIKKDPEYMYNFMSVITYPISKGFQVYKSFSCVEFVVYLLQLANEPFNHPSYQYTPDDLLEHYQHQIVYQGDLREYMALGEKDETYFKSLTMALIFMNALGLYKILKRCAWSFLIDFIEYL